MWHTLKKYAPFIKDGCADLKKEEVSSTNSSQEKYRTAPEEMTNPILSQPAYLDVKETYLDVKEDSLRLKDRFSDLEGKIAHAPGRFQFFKLKGVLKSLSKLKKNYLDTQNEWDFENEKFIINRVLETTLRIYEGQFCAYQVKTYSEEIPNKLAEQEQFCETHNLKWDKEYERKEVKSLLTKTFAQYENTLKKISLNRNPDQIVEIKPKHIGLCRKIQSNRDELEKLAQKYALEIVK